MFIARVLSKGKKGQTYQSILLRESYRVGSRVASRTLAVLTRLPSWLVEAIEQALKRHQGDSQTDAKTEENVGQEVRSDPVQALVGYPESPVRILQGPSFGALWLAVELAKSMGIVKALSFGSGERRQSALALWRVCAHLLFPGTSLLGMTRMASMSVATRLIDFQRSWTEDDLYAHGAWLVEKQAQVETRLWEEARAKDEKRPKDDLFLYDVTSSYFEGIHNELSAFGYSRDGKTGKLQVVVGLLTDGQGEPRAIRVFEGNTQDPKTFAQALHQVRDQFQCKNVVMVGDRGMIKSPQIQEMNQLGIHSITALTKPQINKLIEDQVLNRELFEEEVTEVIDATDQTRYIVRRNPLRQSEIAANRDEKINKLNREIAEANTYLATHPRAQVATQQRRLQEKLNRRKIAAFASLEVDQENRRLSLRVDSAAKAEVAHLDGCYAIKTQIPPDQCEAQIIHDRYKDLSQVEQNFRNLKTGHLEFRPWFVVKEENTRARAFSAMLALILQRRLQKAWAQENLTVEEGLRELEKLCILKIQDKATDQIHETLPEPTPLQARLLKAAGVKLPKRIPPQPKDITVDTRTKLPSERKAA